MRIAVIRLSSFGDVLCTGPAVRGLRAAFPEAEIVFVTTAPYAELAAALPGVDRVAAVERRGEGFRRDVRELAGLEGGWDRVADLHGSSRSRRIARALGAEERAEDRPPRFRRTLLLTLRLSLGHFLPVPLRMIRALREWGVEDDGGSLRLEIAPGAAQSVQERFQGPEGGTIVLVPGAKHATKRWPGGYWADLASMLEKDAPIVVVGGGGDTPPELSEALRDRPRALDLTGKTTPLEAAAVMARAGVVVSGDTGPMHMAVAVGVPLVALFGPTVRQFGFYPFRATRAVVLEQELWCRPCAAHGSARCPLGHHRCLRETLPEQVFEAALRLRSGELPDEQNRFRGAEG